LAEPNSSVRPTARQRRTFKQKWALISLPNKLMVIATIVIALATIVNVLVAWKLGTDTHTLAEAAHTLAWLEKEQFQVAQRPIVALTEDTGSPQLVGLGQVVWEWRFTNYGKTPAQQVRIYQAIRLGQQPFEKTVVQDAAPIPPGKIDKDADVSAQKITPAQFSAYLQALEPNGISIQGRITYEDAYHNKYETGFCLTRLNSGAISYCEPGNYIN
jgi:hypothetical protein